MPTYSALQLAAEYMPECTDPLKIKNTASHIISGNRTISYSMGIWFISQEYNSQNEKPAKNSIYCGVKKMNEAIFHSPVCFHGTKSEIFKLQGL
jgi:hypothetical protein